MALPPPPPCLLSGAGLSSALSLLSVCSAISPGPTTLFQGKIRRGQSETQRETQRGTSDEHAGFCWKTKPKPCPAGWARRA